MTFGILGSGSWGTAIAKILTDNGHIIHWWYRSEQAIHQMMETKHNPPYLSGTYFNTNLLKLTTDPGEVIRKSDCIIVAIPSAYVTSILLPLDKNIFFEDYESGINTPSNSSYKSIESKNTNKKLKMPKFLKNGIKKVSNMIIGCNNKAIVDDISVNNEIFTYTNEENTFNEKLMITLNDFSDNTSFDEQIILENNNEKESQTSDICEENVKEEELPAPAAEPEPVVEEKQPAAEPEPVVEEEQPAAEPEPVVEEEQPAAEPEPVVEEEVPAAEPEPVVEEEQPAAEPEPVVEEEVPAADPEPVVEEEQPAPEPEPVVEEEQPAPEPIVEKEQPAPEPVVEEEQPVTIE